MSFEKIWKKALDQTEIVRPRVKSLQTVAATAVPYILLSESSINVGDTVVRRGEVVIESPALILPPNLPQFEGFNFDDQQHPVDEDQFMNFLLVRGVRLPSLRYNNQSVSLDLFEGRLSEAIAAFHQELIQQENVNTGLLIGPEDYWPLSVLIYVCTQVSRNAPSDIKALLERWRKRGRDE